jgi:NitT/TauT family transport system substrate-binding protein
MMRMWDLARPRMRTGFAVIAAVALIATGCGNGDDTADEAATGTDADTEVESEPDAEGDTGDAGTEEIVVLLPNPSAVNVFNLCAAIGEGYLDEEGITVDVEAVDGSGAVIQAMVAGQAQIGLPGPGPVLNARQAGEELRMFYNSFSQSLFGLVVPGNSEIQSIEDLQGETIGVGTAEGAEVSYARAILSDAGLEEETDYEFLSVGDGGPATAAFERGEIAAYSAAISDMAIIEARGLALQEITPDEFLAFFGNGYAATVDYMEENREVIAGFTRALLRGNEWALDNKEGTLEHCAELNPEEGRDAELASALYDAIVPRSQPLGDDPVGAYPAEGWEAWEQSLLEAGELDESVDDLEAAYTNEFVEAGA